MHSPNEITSIVSYTNYLFIVLLSLFSAPFKGYFTVYTTYFQKHYLQMNEGKLIHRGFGAQWV